MGYAFALEYVFTGGMERVGWEYDATKIYNNNRNDGKLCMIKM